MRLGGVKLGGHGKRDWAAPHNGLRLPDGGHGVHFRADAKPIHEENDGGPGSRSIGIENMGIGNAIRRFDVHGLLGQGTLPGGGALRWEAARISESKAGGTSIFMSFSDSMN